MTERRLLWFFLVALLAVDVFLLIQQRQTGRSFRDLQNASTIARVESFYADEEQALLTKVRAVPEAFALASIQEGGAISGEVNFVLLASIDDCTNCIEDEIIKLNELVGGGRTPTVGVTGFFVDEARATTARRFIDHLSPRPRFPIAVENALAGLAEATTPLVLVIRSRDRKILDAHKPIPQNLAKRDAFYARWAALIGSERGGTPDGGGPFVSEGR